MHKILMLVAVAAICVPAWPADGDNKDTVNAEEIIKKFAAKEAEFREARNNYTYRQTVKMQELDAGGNPEIGKWEEVDDIIFSPEGRRMEKVVWAPVVNLQHIQLTPQDAQDLRDVQPFVLTTSEIPEYNIAYLGREKVDEVGCYTFSVKPKKMVKDKRYFEGQIWVDDRDLQIVKTYGKGVGIVSKNNQFPKFETYREQIDGKYWFPTYTHADDTLHFPDGEAQRIRMTVKYQDYKRYEGKSTIKYGDIVDDKTAPPPPPKKK
ncbi:MAG: hypothetical protein LAP87_01935 [Acidobacteriia bacterium]|nr:hypothetical protein [Terriglobia bacterium]